MSKELYKYKVLYIEDDAELNKKVTQRLQNYFSEVYSASSAEEGYELYVQVKPAVLFVDVNLPKMSGIELLQRIRKNDQNLKAVMLTAHSDVETILQSAELKLTKYLIKPLDRKTLQETIELLVYELENFRTINEINIYFKNNLRWNTKNRELYDASKNKITLTKTEQKVFECFVKNINRVLSYDDISYAVWQEYSSDKKDALKTLLKNLRKKLPKDFIVNEYAVGYKMLN